MLVYIERIEWDDMCASLQFPQRTRRNLEQEMELAVRPISSISFNMHVDLIWLSYNLWIEILFSLQFSIKKVKVSKEITECRETSREKKITNISNWQMWEHRKRVNETESWRSHSVRLALCWNTLPEDRKRGSRESMQKGGREVGMAT